MSDKAQISSSPHAMYGNATTYHDSPSTEGQRGLLDGMFPSSQAYVKNDAGSVKEFLKFKQRPNDNAEAKGFYYERQSMVARPNSVTLPIHNGGAFLPFTEPGFGLFGRSDMDAFQYGLRMDLSHAAGPPGSMKIAGQHQAWSSLSHNIQTSMTETNKKLPCGEVTRYHDKRTFAPAHGTSPQPTNLDYSQVPEIGFGSDRCGLPGQTLSPAVVIYTSDNRDGYARSSASAPPRNKIGGPIVLFAVSNGIKHYRCECGYESVRKGDINHHIESLQHSERKYECSCGKKFTRYDSLNRHRKRCRNDRCQMGSRV